LGHAVISPLRYRSFTAARGRRGLSSVPGTGGGPPATGSVVPFLESRGPERTDHGQAGSTQSKDRVTAFFHMP
jgi:hypothetical protein